MTAPLAQAAEPSRATHIKTDILNVKMALLTFGALCSALIIFIAVGLVFFPASQNHSGNDAPTLSGEIVATLEITAPPQQDSHVVKNEDHGEDAKHHEETPPAAHITYKEDGLTEDSPFGELPIIRASDGMTPFKAYQSRNVSTDAPHKLAILVASYGLAPHNAQKALDHLPNGVTFVLSPYSAAPQTLINTARDKGHEVWMGIPIQGTRYGLDDPGPHALLAGYTPDKNKERLFTNLGKATGYSGVVFDTAAGFAAAPTTMAQIIAELQQRGLGISVLDPTSQDQITKNISDTVPFIPNTLQLDKNPAELGGALTELVQTTQTRPCTVASFSPTPQAIVQIGAWIKAQQERNSIQFVPLSAIATCETPHAPH